MTIFKDNVVNTFLIKVFDSFIFLIHLLRGFVSSLWSEMCKLIHNGKLPNVFIKFYINDINYN